MRRAVTMLLGWAVLAAFCWPGLGLAGGPSQPSVTVVGRAVQGFAPNQARLSLGVETLAPGAAQAAAANAAATAKVLAAVKKLLAPNERLETAGYYLAQRTRWNKERQQNEVVGYQAVHRLQITLSDPKKVGALLDAGVAAGANQVSGPQWGLADENAARLKVQQAAVADALAQARALVQAAKVGLGPLIKMDASGRQPVRGGEVRMAKMAAAPATPMQAAQVMISAEVLCVFALQTRP
ncbi:MAG: SIMPL domain-containing protein [Thermodesulfobacteriota bacterium]